MVPSERAGSFCLVSWEMELPHKKVRYREATMLEGSPSCHRKVERESLCEQERVSSAGLQLFQLPASPPLPPHLS